MQPGEYYAQLAIGSDAANAVSNVPVTLTILPPATWGQLGGTVTGLGYCDVTTPTLLEDAEVWVESSTGFVWPLTTDVSGTYQLWLDEAHSPLTVTVDHPAHVSRVITNVIVTAGTTTTVDFDLRLLQPCLSYDPASLEATLQMGSNTVELLTLDNTGAGDG